MDDNTNYVNTYLELVMKYLHENLNEIIQLKTQGMILNGLVSKKDEAINELKKEIDLHKNNNNELVNTTAKIDQITAKSSEWEAKYNSMLNKVSHVDGLLAQVNDMKRIIQEKDSKISELEDKIIILNTPVINKRKKKITKSELPIEDVNSVLAMQTTTDQAVNDF